jgi:peptidoglycan hydrolase CwlO-like protein
VRRLVVMTLALMLFVPVASAQDENTLRDRVNSGKARERSLANAADRLGALERKATREVTILEGRLGAVQLELTEAETRLAATEAREAEARRRVTRLRKRLAEVRAKLAGLLRERYMGGRPDFVTVVLHADGFPQLLDTLSFVKRVERADTRLLDLVRDARGEAGTEQRELTRLAARQQRQASAVRVRRNALASIAVGLRERRDTIARAHAARVAALGRTRAGRRTAERELTHLLAERARAARAPSGAGGPWAIPWPIVQCESGGQNLPPNSAGASGYYQFLPDTWRGLGGSTPQAYQASKAEQDRLAAQLWAGGAGRHNWVCADLV